MGKIIFNLFYNIANFSLLGCLIFFFINVKKIKTKKEFYLILVYLIISSVVISFFDLEQKKIMRYNFNFFNVQLFYSLFHFSILTYFIQSQLNIKKSVYLVLFFFFISVIFLFIYFDIKNGSYYTVTLSNFLLLIFCLLYYFYLFKYLPVVNLDSDPAFYAINGIFFSSAMLIPILLFGNYLRTILNVEQYNYVGTIAPLASIVLYLFFIKSLLCIIKVKN
jgi:hypothetical protein